MRPSAPSVNSNPDTSEQPLRSVVFLVKNGIGFGHIRRAILLAEAVRAQGRLRPVIVSQASSLQLYTTTTIPVVNFPLLHRVSSAVAEDCYTEILDRLLERLDPAVVIEDTYPDPRYLALPALADRPRLLVMRRMDGASFDHLREAGRFTSYDRILIAQRPEDFAREGHSGQSTAAVASSGVFTFIGNLHHTPTAADIHEAGIRYAPEGQPLVVVNGGAGGDQLHDGYGDRLFGACATVAARLLKNDDPARFVLVTGPYYAGRPLENTPNVTVAHFEPQLAALLAAAHVAVIKPGNNALAEALHGHAQLILVPDASFLEGLDAHATRVTDEHGGTVASPDADALEPLIRTALVQPPRRRRPPPNPDGIAAVLTEIGALARRGAARLRPRPCSWSWCRLPESRQPTCAPICRLFCAIPLSSRASTSPSPVRQRPSMEGTGSRSRASSPRRPTHNPRPWSTREPGC